MSIPIADVLRARAEKLGFRFSEKDGEYFINFGVKSTAPKIYVFQTVGGLLSWLEDAEYQERFLSSQTFGSGFESDDEKRFAHN